MDKSRILALMANKTGNCATAGEMEELAALLSKYPEYAYLSEIVQSLKGNRTHQEHHLPKEELVNTGWQQLEARLNGGSRIGGEIQAAKKYKYLFNTRYVWAAAAMVAFCIIALVYSESRSAGKQPAVPVKVLAVEYGGLSKITLADGTKVWLNAGSKLVYPDTFAGSAREVSLEGEAFFEVTKNVHKPFLVHAGEITVKVLGTIFNVKAYREDSDIETTLISGKVQVTLDHEPDKEITLSPHEKLTVVNPEKNDNVKPASEKAGNALKYQVQQLPYSDSHGFVETAWLTNKLVLNNEGFENVARLLERKYNIQVYFDNNNLKQEHVSGIFEKENILQVLEVLKMTTRFSYRISGNTVHLF